MSAVGGILRAALPFRWRLSRKIGLALYYGAVVGAGMLAVFGRLASPGDGALRIDRAEYMPLADFAAPAPAAGEMVDLPNRCAAASIAARCTGLFRLAFERPGGEKAPLSLYVPYYAGRLQVRLNGTYLVDTEDIRTSVVLNQAEPLFLVLPQPPLRDGRNVIEIRIGAKVGTRLATYLDRVYVGPEAVLLGFYEIRYGAFKTLPRLIVAWQAALGLSLLVVWVGRRRERMYLTLCGILCLGVLHGLTQFLSDGAIPEAILVAADLTAMWQATLMPGLVAGLVGRKSPLSFGWTLPLPTAVTAMFILRLAFPAVFQPRFAGTTRRRRSCSGASC
jgi:hypothetical protein